MDAVVTFAAESLLLVERHSLAELGPGAAGVVAEVDRGAAPEMLVRRLMELGFVRGERIEVLAEARPGRDPFVVRVGDTTLAMRRDEARAVRIEPLADPPR